MLIFFIVLFACSGGVSYLEYKKEKSTNNLLIFILSIVGTFLSVTDSIFSQIQFDNIERLGKINTDLSKKITKLQELNNKLDSNINEAVVETQKLSGKNYSLTDSIKQIDTAIKNISNKINNYVGGDDSYPLITFNSAYEHGQFRRIILRDVGKYPLHGLAINIEYNVYHHPAPSDNHWGHFDVEEVANTMQLDTIILSSNWKEFPVQRFSIDISATNGLFHEEAVFIESPILIRAAYWVFKYKTAAMTAVDTLYRPNARELESFIKRGVSTR
ncbi:MAG: hypothetical protein ABIY90_04950 [Puia sp.]